MNKIILSGNITKDIEIRSTETIEIATGSVAVSRSYKNKNGDYETDFFDFSIMKPTDYQKKNLKKGTKVLIDGEVRINSYEDKHKVNRKDYEIRVNRIEIFKKPEEQTEANEFSAMHTKTEYQENEVQLKDSDLPF